MTGPTGLGSGGATGTQAGAAGRDAGCAPARAQTSAANAIRATDVGRMRVLRSYRSGTSPPTRRSGDARRTDTPPQRRPSRSAMWRAIMSSSLVGTTQADTLLAAV